MLEKQFLSDHSIISCLNTGYGIEVATLRFLPLGADMNASVYKAYTPDNRCYFIKIKRGYDSDVSMTLAKLLHEAGFQHVILPIKTIDGQQTLRIDELTLIVYPFIEGEDGFKRDLTSDQWVILGKALRQIHELEVPFSIQKQIRKEAYSPKWREAVRSILSRIDSALNKDEIALKLLRFIKENRAAIHRLVDRAEQLGQKLKGQSAKFVLCHSDIHGGNVLIDENDTIYIVDWDEPIMAPKERDLMFIGGGVANVWNKPREEEFFYKGYGPAEIDRAILAYYRHERIVEDIAQYSQELLLAPVSGGDKQEMYKHFIDMFEPQGVVDIAFKTDKGLSI